MSNVSFPVFYIPFGECSIANFDFTELKKDTRWVKGASQNMYGNDYTEDRYKILDSYPELKRLILSNFFKYTNEIGVNTNFILTTSWLTQCRKGETIASHCHKNCEFSGILYYDDDYTDQPPLIFANPLPRLTQFQPSPGSGETTGYTNHWNRYPEKGLLLFWPAYIEHSMMAKKTDKPRRSLAFNFSPIGLWGNADSTMSTSWLSS